MVIKEIQEKVDWVNYMDAEAMKTMMKTSRDLFAITNLKSQVILPNSSCLLLGPLIIGLGLGKKFCNTSSNVRFNIFNKMNFDLAYFDVSYNIEILHLNDSN